MIYERSLPQSVLVWMLALGFASSCGTSSSRETQKTDAAFADSSLAISDVSVLQDTLSRDSTGTAGTGLDCSVSQEAYCVSVTAVMNGQTATFACLPSNKGLISKNSKQFSFLCSTTYPTALTLSVTGPEKGEGTFSVGYVAAQSTDPNLEMLDVSDDTRNLTLSSKAINVSDATLKWTESSGGTYTGSFTGTWSAPTGSCSFFGYPCAGGSLQGSFKFTWP
jgi:hypothetical protein